MIARPAGGAARIIPALDTGDPARAAALAAALAPHCGLLKVGLELFCAAGGAAGNGCRAASAGVPRSQAA
jgi:orotidine-5'-phosphate decarboxylase